MSWIKNNYNLITVIIIVLVSVDICFHISSYILNSEHIVLVFVGILATFIVVSNYSQVRDIKEDFDKHIKSIKETQETYSNELEKHKENVEKSIKLIYMDMYMKEGLNFKNLSEYSSAIESFLRSLIYALEIENEIQSLKCIDYIKSIENHKKLLEEEMIGEWINDIKEHENYIIIRNEFEDLIK
ncbi:hypothetical protein Barb6_02735 [Bacteroidales bacterium Barb6]|nr:hypothetical protein Barb6_02735 [Bacteroidales bacterium Barb6]